MGWVLRSRPAARARRRPPQPQPQRQLRPGRVHTSILRFIEWRFLGAPATGPSQPSGRWWLTKRDRNAANLGASLRASNPDPELWFAFDDSEPGLSTEMLVPCDKLVDVSKTEAEWSVYLDPAFLDLIDQEFDPATDLPWLQS
jgi:hypothetical protein